MLQDIFENMIHKYDPAAKIYYFKNFSRARVDMNSVAVATTAKQELHGRQFGARILKCYFFRVSTLDFMKIHAFYQSAVVR